eukprot:TRINITY_DN26680_c0_g1_i1.p1 TRINITY_DN26680_c0_g1~~TRINITY_DN26680_c0_g1_i1.p1  ORF type:complete len:260 (+),score=21.20 TRINITY_DN26680_c0_g1_i1:79-780(+)
MYSQAPGRFQSSRAEQETRMVCNSRHEQIVLFTSFLDFLRLMLLKVEVEMALECIELLGFGMPFASVVGLCRASWERIKIHTTVRGRPLPRGSCLAYGILSPTSSPVCFSLARFLDVVSDLLQRRDLDLAMKLFENVSADAPFAHVVNLDSEVLMSVKRRIATEAPQLQRPAMLAVRNLRRRTTGREDDEGGEHLNGGSMMCAMGLDRSPLSGMSTRAVPPEALSAAPDVLRQ